MAKTSSKPKSEYAIQTVSNALRMLEVFHDENEMGVSDLARTLGRPLPWPCAAAAAAA